MRKLSPGDDATSDTRRARVGLGARRRRRAETSRADGCVNTQSDARRETRATRDARDATRCRLPASPTRARARARGTRGRDEEEGTGRRASSDDADAPRGESTTSRAVETTKRRRRDLDRRACGTDANDDAGLLDEWLLRGGAPTEEESAPGSSRSNAHDIDATMIDTNGLFHDISPAAFAFERYDAIRYCSSCKQNLSAESFPGWHRKTCSSCLRVHSVAQRRRRRNRKRLQSE